MPLTDIATINVSSQGAGVTRPGYGVPMIVSHSAKWPERIRFYTNIAAVAVDFPVNSPEYLAASEVFSQSPQVVQIAIGRAANVPTQQYAIGVQAVSLNAPYPLQMSTATGVVWVPQNTAYNPGAGATGWAPSGVWSQGNLVIADGSKLYTCLGKSGPTGVGGGLGGGFTGIGAASGPSGTLASIQEGQIFWMYAGSGTTGGASNDSIINGVKAAVEALNSPPVVGVGAAQVLSSLQGSAGSRTLQLTGNAPGTFFGAQVQDRNVLNIVQNHADPGIVADLTAIALQNNNWYGLITLFNSAALIQAAAAWVETNVKLYAAASLDSQIPRVAQSIATDVANSIKTSAYARTWVFFHSANDEFADAAEMGKFFPVSPGGETWRMKTLSGVAEDAFSGTELANMLAKYAHYYYDLGGVSVVGGDAKDGAGEYIDVVRFIDWYTSELQAAIVDLAIGLNKIPFTNAGIDLVAAKVEAQNLAGIAAGGISPTPTPTVFAPDVSSVSSGDKAARQLNGVTSTWTLAGAIHHITVTVTANT